MKKPHICLIVLITITLAFQQICEAAAKPPTQSPTKDFYLITYRKSGTHLLAKLLCMLTNRFPYGLFELIDREDQVSDQEFAREIAICKMRNQFPYNHIGEFGQLFANYSKKHPDYVRILQIRDLKDVFVSYVYYFNDMLESSIGPSTFDEKLTYLLDLERSHEGLDFEKSVKLARNWVKMEDVVVCRFEEIVGPRGGGNAQTQKKAILKLAEALNVSLDPARLQKIINELFGNETGPRVSANFRSGQIGSWKTHFNDEHIALFNKYWMKHQKALGYKEKVEQ